MRKDAAHLDQVKKMVAESLEKDFDHDRIVDILVKEAVDADGDRLLKILVIFKGSPTNLDLEKLSGAINVLHSRLDEIEDSSFPLLSFVSKADYEARAS